MTQRALPSLRVAVADAARRSDVLAEALRNQGHDVVTHRSRADFLAAPEADACILGSQLDATARWDAEEASRLMQRMDTLGSMSAGIAHEFNNLMTVVMGSLLIGLASLVPVFILTYPVFRVLAPKDKPEQAAADLRQIQRSGPETANPVDLCMEQVAHGC